MSFVLTWNRIIDDELADTDNEFIITRIFSAVQIAEMLRS